MKWGGLTRFKVVSIRLFVSVAFGPTLSLAVLGIGRVAPLMSLALSLGLGLLAPAIIRLSGVPSSSATGATCRSGESHRLSRIPIPAADPHSHPTAHPPAEVGRAGLAIRRE